MNRAPTADHRNFHSLFFRGSFTLEEFLVEVRRP